MKLLSFLSLACYAILSISCSSVENKIADKYSAEMMKAGNHSQQKREALEADNELDRNVNNLRSNNSQ